MQLPHVLTRTVAEAQPSGVVIRSDSQLRSGAGAGRSGCYLGLSRRTHSNASLPPWDGPTARFRGSLLETLPQSYFLALQ